MPDETSAAGSWSRPDGGVDPEDYLDDRAAPDGSPPGERRRVDQPVDPEAPGQSVLEDSEGDAVEPNEPG